MEPLRAAGSKLLCPWSGFDEESSWRGWRSTNEPLNRSRAFLRASGSACPQCWRTKDPRKPRLLIATGQLAASTSFSRTGKYAVKVAQAAAWFGSELMRSQLDPVQLFGSG